MLTHAVVFLGVVTVAASLQSHLTLTENSVHTAQDDRTMRSAATTFLFKSPSTGSQPSPPPQFGHQLISPCCIIAPSPRTSIRDWLTSLLLEATRRHRNYLIENINLYPELPPRDDSVFLFAPLGVLFFRLFKLDTNAT